MRFSRLCIVSLIGVAVTVASWKLASHYAKQTPATAPVADAMSQAAAALALASPAWAVAPDPAPQPEPIPAPTPAPEPVADKCDCSGPSSCTCAEGKCGCVKCAAEAKASTPSTPSTISNIVAGTLEDGYREGTVLTLTVNGKEYTAPVSQPIAIKGQPGYFSWRDLTKGDQIKLTTDPRYQSMATRIEVVKPIQAPAPVPPAPVLYHPSVPYSGFAPVFRGTACRGGS